MNKKELIDEIASRADMPKSEVMCAVGHLQAVIQETLAKGEKVTLTNFGTFEVVEHAARTAYNPHTRDPIAVPARLVPKFKPGSDFKAAVAQGGAK